MLQTYFGEHFIVGTGWYTGIKAGGDLGVSAALCKKRAHAHPRKNVFPDSPRDRSESSGLRMQDLSFWGACCTYVPVEGLNFS